MNRKSLFIARLSLLIAVTLSIQTLGLPQPVTGPLINTLLFLTSAFLGIPAGITLGLITPVVALIRGQLPIILAPMVPFIVLGNASLVLIYSLVDWILCAHTQKQWVLLVPITCASTGKFLLLLLSVRIVVPLIIGHRLPRHFELMMTLPQLLTALIGGIIFLILLRFIKYGALIKTESL